MSFMRSPVAFIGYSNSGKTTLLVELVRRLTARGERVAVIKHTHHDPANRKPRGDTELFLEAGATRVVLAGTTHASILTPELPDEVRAFDDAKEIASWLDADRIFVEGFKSLSLWPRILVERVESEPLRPIPGVVAIVTNSSEAFEVPTFGHDDVGGLIAFLDRIASP